MIGARRTSSSSPVRELPPPLRDGPLLLVEPHVDDAALSCSALLARSAPLDVLAALVAEPEPPRQGSWDCTTGFASSAESIPARIQEERAALADTPHTLLLGALLEGQYLNGRPDRQDPAALVAEIEEWLEHAGGGVVAAPAGAGRRLGSAELLARRLGRGRELPPQHPDHLFVRNVTLDALVSRDDAQIVLYEEFPYRWGARADREVTRVARARGLRPELVVVEVDRGAKVESIRHYASQVPHLTVGGRRVDDADVVPQDERYWLLRRRR